MKSFKAFLKKYPPLTKISRLLRGYQVVLLEYPVKPVPRYGHGKPPHPLLYEMMNRDRIRYKEILKSFLQFKDYLLKIPARRPRNETEPCWVSRWITALDAATLYSLIALRRPERYIEIGSGVSTKFAARAALDRGLGTRIISIDPFPRAEIDSICHEVIRKPVEECDLGIFDGLSAGDFLYVDSSHRCFTNSDVTVIFLEILPRLRPGVVVQFHDIVLPYDYFPEWGDRYYSEQYLLGAVLLAGTSRLKILLPMAFVSQDRQLGHVLDPLWVGPGMEGVKRDGVGFWVEIQ